MINFRRLILEMINTAEELNESNIEQFGITTVRWYFRVNFQLGTVEYFEDYYGASSEEHLYDAFVDQDGGFEWLR